MFLPVSLALTSTGLTCGQVLPETPPRWVSVPSQPHTQTAYATQNCRLLLVILFLTKNYYKGSAKKAPKSTSKCYLALQNTSCLSLRKTCREGKVSDL